MDPIRDTQTCFRALTDATSRPGTVHEVSTSPADHAVLATLVDHEVTCYTPDETIRTALANEERLTPADRTSADFVHAPAGTDGAVREFARGSLKEPSDGATVVYRVDRLATAPNGTGGWTHLDLTGPGVPGERTLAVDGLPAEEAQALADAQSTYPRGVDAILTSEAQVAALPRSVTLEVA